MDFSSSFSAEIRKVEKEMSAIMPSSPAQVYGMMPEYISRGGKRIRPLMIMLCFNALKGSNADAAYKVAALVELFHNFTLMHDDIEDDSHFRRGKPTLHISHSLPIALNSGDAIYTVIWNRMCSLPLSAEDRIRVASICGSAFQKVVEGQGIELDWYRTGKVDITEREYFEMVGGKTGALMGASCEAGAFLAGAKPEMMKKFREFGEALGIAFQIQDDVLNITGKFETYQKEIGGDVTEGKRTLMLIHTLAKSSPVEKEKIIRIIKSNTRNPEEIQYVISVFGKNGSIAHAKETARVFVERAGAFLEKLPKSRETEGLKKMAAFVTEREL